jgi:hypothetical protein
VSLNKTLRNIQVETINVPKKIVKWIKCTSCVLYWALRRTLFVFVKPTNVLWQYIRCWFYKQCVYCHSAFVGDNIYVIGFTSNVCIVTVHLLVTIYTLLVLQAMCVLSQCICWWQYIYYWFYKQCVYCHSAFVGDNIYIVTVHFFGFTTTNRKLNAHLHRKWNPLRTSTWRVQRRTESQHRVLGQTNLQTPLHENNVLGLFCAMF